MKSIEVTLKLLELLASEESGISVLDISRKIPFSKSTTHRALQVLEKKGFAQKDQLSGRYLRGPRMFDLALYFLSHFDLPNLAHPILENIVAQVNETAYLCIYSQEHLFFIDLVECSHPVRYINPMGRRDYMHAGAAGRIIMAFLPEKRVNQIVDRGLPAFTQCTITDPDRLKVELRKNRNDGYAFSNSEFAEGGVTFAAPILDSKSHVVGCITIVIPVDRFVEGKEALFKNLAIESAAKISQLMAKYSLINPVPT